MEHHCHCRTWAGGECTCHEALNNLPKQQATLKFNFIAGLLIRRQVKAELLGAAHSLGVSIDIQSSDGWLDSTYYITVRGDAEKVFSLKNWVERYFKRIEAWNSQ